MVAEISMLTAFTLIIVILISGGARTFFRRKFNVDDELRLIDAAAKRHSQAKQRLHNVQH